MENEHEINLLVERLKSEESMRRYPHLANLSEEDLRLSARIAIAWNKKHPTPSYSTTDIIKMASKQRARSSATAKRHEHVAIDMAVLVRILKMGRKTAALVLSYAHWNEYAPGAILDFYKRHLPKEYGSEAGLHLWLESNYKGLHNYKHNLIGRIERFEQLCKKVPQTELSKLCDGLSLL